MKLNVKTVSASLVLIVTIGTIITMIFALDNRWAKAAELKQVEFRLDQKIQQDRVYSLQERIWKLEDRYEKSPTIPQVIKDELRKLKKEKELIEKVIEKGIDQYKK